MYVPSLAFANAAPLRLSTTPASSVTLLPGKCPCCSGPNDSARCPLTASLSAKDAGSSRSRRAFLRAVSASAGFIALDAISKSAFDFNPAFADAPADAPSVKEAALTGDYQTDAHTLVSDMRVACALSRGAPNMERTVTQVRREMNDFVALYRRNNKVSGNPSFSTLYTAINTLSGHYASYGNAYPVPEKRKKRLNQQFTDVDRALSRGR